MKQIVPPKPTDKQVLRCLKCGAVFTGKLFPFPDKCPQCGSRRVKPDNRIRY